MSIGWKLVGSIAIVVIPVILVSFLTVPSIERELQSLGQFHTPALYAIQDIAAQTMEAVEESFAYVASGSEVEKQDFLKWVERSRELNQRFEVIANLASEEEKSERELFNEIKRQQTDLVTLASRMFSEFESQGSVGKERFDGFENRVDDLFVAFDRMIKIEKEEVEQSHRDALQVIRTSETAILLVGIWCVIATWMGITIPKVHERVQLAKRQFPLSARAAWPLG